MAGSDEAFPATVFEQVHPEMGDRARAFAVESEAYAVGVAGPLSRMKAKLDAVGKAVSDAAAAMSRAAGRA